MKSPSHLNKGDSPAASQHVAHFDSDTDRRLHARVSVDFAIDLEYELDGKFEKTSGIASGLAAKGVTVRLRTTVPIDIEVVVRFQIPGVEFPFQFTGRVAWAFTSRSGSLHGIQFVHLPTFHKEKFYRFLSGRLSSRSTVPERRLNENEIVSELIEFRSRSGKRIVGFHDHVLGSKFAEPVIVIPAAYGETKANAIHSAYYLAKNGFQVLRFDPTNHVGESEGEHEDYKLSTFVRDIHSAIDFVQARAPDARVGLLASSLAARAAIKAIGDDRRVSVLILVAPILNARDTLTRVQNEDVIQTVLDGEYPIHMNALGHDVKTESFLGDCVRGGFENLESTLMDLKRIACPISLILAEQDPWVNESDVKATIEAIDPSRRSLFFLPTMHKLKENPKEAKRAFRITVMQATLNLMNKTIQEFEVLEPRMRELGIEVRVERERSRYLTTFSNDDQRAFWSRYLKRFNYIYSIADYRELLDSVFNALGEFDRDATILDAGCGNGNFALWLARKIQDKRVPHPISYIGTDIVRDALEVARETITQAIDSVKSNLLSADSPINASFQQADLNVGLPFLDNSFDKVCCNLVISYLENYTVAVKELWRVLKPGGKLVITTLKKDADVSRIYRNFIEHATTAEEIEEAKNLLSNAGQIFLKETEGHFRFFEPAEFHAVLTNTIGINTVTIDYCFGDQALMFTLEK